MFNNNGSLVTWMAAYLTAVTDQTEFESYVTTDGQSASLFWNKAPIWCLRPDLHYCKIVAGLLVWCVLSDERTGLSFAIAAGEGQRSHSRVRVPWDSRPYFTLSDLRLPFSSPPTTRSATVEAFHSASTRDPWQNSKLVPLITPRHRPHRKQRSSLLLFSLCRGNMFIYEVVPQQRLPYICLFRVRCPAADVFIKSLFSNEYKCYNIIPVSTSGYIRIKYRGWTY
jgi:hypothetical protein